MNDISKEDKLNNEYFEWMYDLVCNDRSYKDLSYRKLFAFLHNKKFTYTVSRDENRADDGIQFRYRFGYENGYERDEIKRYLDTRPCSVLEMMVSLAFIIEERIMDDMEQGNRTGLWFWNMIVNLGLGTMSDNNFDRDYCEFVIDRFLKRKYEKNGKGGLFVINDKNIDMRNCDIWQQSMGFLRKFVENDGEIY